MRLYLLVLAAALPNLAITCGMGYTDPTRTEPLPATLKQVLDRAREIMRQEGFEEEIYDLDGRVLRSEWKIELAPHWKQGKRQRMTVKVWEEDKGVVASVEIKRDINDNAENPLVAEDASWISGGNNEELQLRVVWLLKMKFKRAKLDD